MLFIFSFVGLFWWVIFFPTFCEAGCNDYTQSMSYAYDLCIVLIKISLLLQVKKKIENVNECLWSTL